MHKEDNGTKKTQKYIGSSVVNFARASTEKLTLSARDNIIMTIKRKLEKNNGDGEKKIGKQ
jgi:hypothetical protein